MTFLSYMATLLWGALSVIAYILYTIEYEFSERTTVVLAIFAPITLPALFALKHLESKK